MANQVMGHGARWRTKSWAGGMLANQVMGRGHVGEPSHEAGACWRTSLGAGAVGEPVLGLGPVGEPVTAGGLLANYSWGEGLLANQSWGGGLLANQVKVQYMAFNTKTRFFSWHSVSTSRQNLLLYFFHSITTSKQNLPVFSDIPPQNKLSVYFHPDKTAMFSCSVPQKTGAHRFKKSRSAIATGLKSRRN